MHRRLPAALASLAACLVLAPAAHGATEAGDAGELIGTAQDLGSDPALDSVDGSFAGSADVDLYRVCLSGGGTFSASTVGGTTADTQLFLFDGAGRGVYGNDDAAGTRQSTLPAGHALAPGAAGEYHFAVGLFNREPQSPAGRIFPDATDGVIAPTGEGAAQPLSGWFGRGASIDSYRVALTGVVRCDETPPAIDLRAPADGIEVERGGELIADYECSDEGSGVDVCKGTVADGEPVDTSTLGPRTFVVTASDVAGNRAEVTHAYTVVDRTAPAVSIASPVDGATYSLGEEVLADYECDDERGGSGLARCEGDVPDGQPVDTSTPGAHTFTVVGEDAAGNVTERSVSYVVALDFGGFLWPLDDPPALNRWFAGVPVPVRFRVAGGLGPDAVADGYPRSARVACGADADPDAAEPTRSIGGGLRYNRRRDRYRYLWRTERRWRGTCRQLLVKLTDGSVRRVNFRFH